MNKKKEKIEYKITLVKYCPWCHEEIASDKQNEHPRYCVFFQEYLRQII